MVHVNIYEAKTHFSKYVEEAEAGKEVIITRGMEIPITKTLEGWH